MQFCIRILKYTNCNEKVEQCKTLTVYNLLMKIKTNENNTKEYPLLAFISPSNCIFMHGLVNKIQYTGIKYTTFHNFEKTALLLFQYTG